MRKSPKLQFLDTGIVNYTLNIQAQLLGMADLSNAYKGAVNTPHSISGDNVTRYNPRKRIEFLDT